MSLSPSRGLVLIPAFNEAGFIQDTVNQVLAHFPRSNVLVVDDGSSDGTYQLAQETGVQVLRHPENLGKGAALATGFRMALEKRVDFVITLDADGQHPPKHIPGFLRAGQRFDLVIGNRRPFKGMPLANQLSNNTTSLAISLMTRTRLSDTQCGYRLIKTPVLRRCFPRTARYQAESEILVKAAWLGFRIGQVPIDVVYGSAKSHIRAHRDVPLAVGLALRLLMQR